MENFISAIQGVLEIVIIITVGYILANKNWFDIKIADLFAKLVLNVSLPLNIMVNITSFFKKEELISLASDLTIPFLSIILSFFLGYFLAEIFKVKKGRKGIFVGIFSLSNSIFIGLPMSQALFGERATPFTLLYYMANTTIWWSAGVYVISMEADKNVKIFSWNTIKRVFNIPLIGFIIGVILVLLDITLPKFLFESFKMIGNLTTPLSLFYVGIIIKEMGVTKFYMDKDTLLIFIGRFLVSPILVIGLSYLIKVPKITRDVFVIMSAMPAMVNSAIVARIYNADYEFAVKMITYTTLLSIMILPLWMTILNS